MKQRIKISALRTLGVLLIILGVMGLFLPVLQGVLFIILGLYLATFGNVSFHEKLRARASRAPKLLAAFEAFDARMKRWVGVE